MLKPEKISEAARLLNEWEKLKNAREATCVVCGAKFVAFKPHCVYCSNECRQKAYYRRRKEKAAGNNPATSGGDCSC